MFALLDRLGRLRECIAPPSPATPAHPAYVELLSRLTGAGDNIEPAKKLLFHLEKKRQYLDRHDALVYLWHRHPAPHMVNYLLAEEEIARCKETVVSLPTHVWMDLSSICNVECRFCKYTSTLLPKEIVTLDQVRAIEWLKYVRVLNLSSGTGESLTNPHFLDIFEYLRTRYPHLNISFLTNGKALTERVLRAVAGKLDQVHVSMNASNEDDYNRIIRRGNWQVFARNMETMREVLRGLQRPKVTASFVMMRWNVRLAVEYLDFAAAHGASLVLFHHYYTPYIQDVHGADPEALEEKFPATESLYYDKELSDEVFSRVKRRAEELKVEVQVPPPFTGADVVINYGARSLSKPPDNCTAPWLNLYLLWGIKSKQEEVTICCGLASDIGVYFNRDELATVAGLQQVWNSPILQAYRRTANGPRQNPLCRLCRQVDHFDPAAVYPDQKSFFTFADLDLPDHFRDNHRVRNDQAGGGTAC